MKTVALALFFACVVGSSLAQDCSAKVKDFHECLKKGHQHDKEGMKTKFADMKTKIDACYTENGCTAPVKGKGKGGASSSGGSSGGASGGSSGGASGGVSGEKDGAGRECRKALKAATKKSFQDCLQKAGVTVPQKDGDDHHEKHFGGHHKGMNHKGENKGLEGCAKKEQVRACKKALFEKSKPSDAEMKAKFDAGCKARDTCLAALGADCQAQIQKFKKASCECRQQQFQQLATLRTSVKECQSVPQKAPRQGKGGKKAQHNCNEEKKDYCKLGFDALKAKFGGSHH